MPEAPESGVRRFYGRACTSSRARQGVPVRRPVRLVERLVCSNASRSQGEPFHPPIRYDCLSFQLQELHTMSTKRVSRRYPWGTQSPTTRIRDLSTKTTVAIAATDEPGFAQTHDRVTAAVQATFALVQVVEHLATAGLRVVGTKATPLLSEEVSAAVDSVRAAVGTLAESTVVNQGEAFQQFCDAVTRMQALAEQATQRGVEGTGDSGAKARGHTSGFEPSGVG